MTLKIHNTLTKNLDDFVPISDDKVTLYTCGPTVYDYLHVGNWAAYIYWDILVRTLMANGYTVERVMNITDVGHLVSDEDDGEDKMQKGARRESKTAWEVAEFYSKDFLDGMKKLDLIMPEHITKATDFIPEQLELVRTLKVKGYTYQIDDGIYYDTSKFPSYADFAGLDLAAQRAGARVTFNDEKRNPSDFALWKFSPVGEKRDMEWDTPSDIIEGAPRKGFPGWHLECSAMAMSILGNTIDLHTGGIDHISVHHTNEIAQSESASDQHFVNYWLHNNHLKVDGTKISKRLGNGYTLQDLTEKGFSPLDYRMFVLQGQYSNEGNFTFENLEAAKNRLTNWRNVAALRWQTHDTLRDDDEKSDGEYTLVLATSGAIIEALSNDLDTPTALRIVDEAFSVIEGKDLASIHQFSLKQLLKTIDDVLGLRLLENTPDISDDDKRLILQRRQARQSKDWQKSDELRNKLLARGVRLKDTPHGIVWHYA
ncbi:MAG: cysteine--tRNA ligase [Candidatus Saccharimonadales bacterium]